MHCNKDALIVVSGGMDSVTMLHEFADEIALAVTFDYGSLQNAREIPCAARHCRELGIRHVDADDIPFGDHRIPFHPMTVDLNVLLAEGLIDETERRLIEVTSHEFLDFLACVSGINDDFFHRV